MMKYCFKCRAELADDALFCPRCGQSQVENNNPQSNYQNWQMNSQMPTNQQVQNYPPVTVTATVNQPVHQPSVKKKRGCFMTVLLVLLWICFFPIMIVIKAIRTKKIGWIIGAGIVWVVLLISFISTKVSKIKEENVKLIWPNSGLAMMLPEPKTKNGKINTDSETRFAVNFYKVTNEDFSSYVTECKDKGFDVDVTSNDSVFYAYNTDNYKLDLIYFGNDNRLDLFLDAPERMDNYSWPTSDIVSLLPVPESQIGKIKQESTDRFVIYVAETSQEQYIAYVKACQGKGFTVDYSKDEKSYRADNTDGYHVDLEYQRNNTMLISIEEPKKRSTSTPESKATTAAVMNISTYTAAVPTQSILSEAPTAAPTENTQVPVAMIDGMHTEFKEAMDSYEVFFDNYCDFMKKYKESGNSVTMLPDYLKFLAQYTETMQKMEAMPDENLSDIEMNYFIQVQTRINNKLLEVAQ
jgi:hypothetical protein